MDAMQFPNPAGYDQLAKGAMRTSFTRDAARRLGQAAADPERAREAAAGFESAFLHRLLDATRGSLQARPWDNTRTCSASTLPRPSPNMAGWVSADRYINR